MEGFWANSVPVISAAYSTLVLVADGQIIHLLIDTIYRSLLSGTGIFSDIRRLIDHCCWKVTLRPHNFFSFFHSCSGSMTFAWFLFWKEISISYWRKQNYIRIFIPRMRPWQNAQMFNSCKWSPIEVTLLIDMYWYFQFPILWYSQGFQDCFAFKVVLFSNAHETSEYKSILSRIEHMFYWLGGLES